MENKYVRTFDGGDGIVNGDVFIQDNLTNEKMSIEQYTIYDFSVMDVVCVRDDCQPQISHKVIELKLPWTMFGNIEGSFGTMVSKIYSLKPPHAKVNFIFSREKSPMISVTLKNETRAQLKHVQSNHCDRETRDVLCGLVFQSSTLSRLEKCC